jgi:tetratricopeptide (TPR) repeat protein
VILIAAIAAAPTARAQDKDAERKAAAKQHWQRGTSYYDLGRYPEAIKEFEAAYQLKNDPAFLYNLAQAYRLAGDAENALRLYRTYLRYVPKPANRAEIDDRIEALEQQIAQEKAAGTAPPPGGGGTAPPPPGGGGTTPPGGGTTQPPPPNGGPPPPPAGGITPPPTGGTPPPPGFDPNAPGTGGPPPGGTAPPPGYPPPSIGMTPPQPSTRGKTLQTAGLITAGVGGVLLLVAIVEGLRARSASQQIEDAAADRMTYDPAVEKRGQSAEKVEIFTAITGLLAVGGGGVLWYLGRKQEMENTTSYRISLSPLLPAGGGGALLRVRF